MRFFSFFKLKKAAPLPSRHVPPTTPTVPDWLEGSDITSQITWLTATLLQVGRILNQPSNQTLKDLPAHAERVMVELLERRERDRKNL